MSQGELRFDGPMFDPALDAERLGRQLRAVRDYMLDLGGRERTVPEIAADLHFPECSISARLRDLRKPRFGGYRVESRRVTPGGLYTYRLLRPDPPAADKCQHCAGRGSCGYNDCSIGEMEPGPCRTCVGRRLQKM